MKRFRSIMPVLLCISVFSCSKKSNNEFENIDTRKSLSVTYSFKGKRQSIRLTDGEGRRVKHLLKYLPKVNKKIFSKPDYVVRATLKNSTSFQLISVFIKEQFVYKGQYLDAWTMRMQNKSVAGVRASPALLGYLNSVVQWRVELERAKK